ncbi:MAG: SRPBCC domain-containing protein [Variibacter sp.]
MSRATTKPSLTIKRRLNAPPAKDFAARTDPEKIVRWWGPSNAAETHHVEVDVREGGGFRIVFRDESGEDHDVRGIYREVVPDTRLVFTWSWRTMPERESLVTVALKPEGDMTLLTLIHEQFFDEAARDRHNWGWNGAMDKLERMFV